MIFEYICDKCNIVFEKEFPIGKADPKLACMDCNSDCERYYGNQVHSVIFKGGGWPGKSATMNREQTKKNEDAERRMWKERTGTAPKLVDQR